MFQIVFIFCWQCTQSCQGRRQAALDHQNAWQQLMLFKQIAQAVLNFTEASHLLCCCPCWASSSMVVPCTDSPIAVSSIGAHARGAAPDQPPQPSDQPCPRISWLPAAVDHQNAWQQLMLFKQIAQAVLNFTYLIQSLESMPRLTIAWRLVPTHMLRCWASR